MSDLPDFFSVTLGGDAYAPAGWAGIGLGVEVGISSDRFGNDYVTLGAGVGAGVNLTPGTVKYTEGYVGGMVVDWGTGLPSQLSVTELQDAMLGFDVGAGITVYGLSLSGEVGVDIPPKFRTAIYGMEIVNLIGVEILGGSITLPLPIDLPFTPGWAELDAAIQCYSRSDFE